MINRLSNEQPKVLVMDDEESIRFTFEKFLSQDGFAVETAEGLSQADELITSETFDVAVVDRILAES